VDPFGDFAPPAAPAAAPAAKPTKAAAKAAAPAPKGVVSNALFGARGDARRGLRDPRGTAMTLFSRQRSSGIVNGFDILFGKLKSQMHISPLFQSGP